MEERTSRRSFFLKFAGFGFVSLGLRGEDPPVEYFRKTKWFEMRPGRSEPRVLEGNFVLNRREEKVAFFARSTKRFEIPLKKLKALAYDYGQRPADPTYAETDWTKMFNRSRRHFLTIEYQDAEGYFKNELLELTKKQWNEVIVALEYATGLQTTRR